MCMGREGTYMEFSCSVCENNNFHVGLNAQ